MKKVYIIYEKGYGNIGVTFENIEDAKTYIDIANKTNYEESYFIRENVVYNDFDEYTANNKEKLISLLEEALRMIKLYDYEHILNFKNGKCKMTYNDIKKTIEENKLRLISFSNGGYYYDTVKEDLEVVKQKYLELNSTIEKYKSMIKKLSKTSKTTEPKR